jgi:hypothetical protein
MATMCSFALAAPSAALTGKSDDDALADTFSTTSFSALRALDRAQSTPWTRTRRKTWGFGLAGRLATVVNVQRVLLLGSRDGV